MAHSRNIKPSFFIDENIVDLSFQGRILFIGLWCLADREGRLDDKPKQIKMQIFPADDVNVAEELEHLAQHNVIKRYSVEGKNYIKINNFLKHQTPHPKEAKSKIPDEDGPLNVITCKEHEVPETAAKLSLNPESGILNPESGEVSSFPQKAEKPPSTPIEDLNLENWEKLPSRALVKLSSEWWLPQKWGEYAENLGWPEGRITTEAHKFRGYWTEGKGAGKRKSPRGWRQAWGNWIEIAARKSA